MAQGVMTVDELSDYLRVHKSTVYRMLKRKGLPAFKMGSDWRFLKSAIDQWMIDEIMGQANGATLPKKS